MAISDYIPNVFGQAAPSYLQGLLGAEETQNLQNRANVQGLLGAGLALAQGMSRTGPRRSAAENILGALSGGFGAAGGAYEQGVKNYVTQQQIAQTQLAQGQAVSKLKSIAQAKATYPDLAPLFDIDAGKAMEQVILRENAKIYGLGTDVNQVPAQVSAQIPSQVPTQVTQQPELISNQAQTQTTQLVDPANVAKANDNRKKAALALSRGDKDTAGYFEREAERLDPKEVISFRDGMAFSNKRGLIANYGGTRLLTAQEIKDKDLDPNKRYQVGMSGTITEVPTNITSTINKKQLIDSLPTQAANVYPTLKPRFDALVKRADGLTADQINSEITSILDADSKILADLDPKLQEAELRRRKASKTDVNVFPAGSMPLGKEGANKVDTQLLDLGQGRLRLQSISANFNPKYLETPFKLKMEGVAQLEKLGKKPSPEDAADLAGYSEFAQNAYNELNAYINLITGAAVGSGDEEARLRKGVPDPQKDSPTQFITKLNTKIKEGRLYEARLGYIKSKGMKITDAGLVDVNQIPTMMRNREAEIKNNKKLFGNQEYNAKDPNHKAIVRSILSKEFGLVD